MPQSKIYHKLYTICGILIFIIYYSTIKQVCQLKISGISSKQIPEENSSGKVLHNIDS